MTQRLLTQRSWLAKVVGGLALASAMAGHAQVSTPVVRFTVFSAQPVKGVAFVPRPKAAPETLVFRPTARSVRCEYRGAMPLRFFDANDGSVVAEANIPAGIQHALLLFSPLEPGKSAAGLRYQIAVLDDGASRLGAGKLAIINLSGLTLNGRINNQPVTLKAGLNPPLAVGRTTNVRLSMIAKGKTYQSYAGDITLERNERALLILFPPYYKGGYEVQSRLLVDQPPAGR